jgi:poly-gamma-glutamate synthesis protein (capsule biosynthesis protein)
MGNPLTEDGVMVQIEIEKNHETNDTIIKNINFIPTWIHRYRNSAGIQYDILPIEEVLVDDSQSELTEKVITRIKKSANDTITTLHSESN